MENFREEMRSHWDADGHNYDEIDAHGINDGNDLELWKDTLTEHKGARLLDVGAGTGFVSLIAAECGLDVTALDWSETMLAQAREKAKSKNLEITFVNGIIELLPFEKDSFDVLTARHVMWTLAYPAAAFMEWLRVLKPGGVVYADYSPRKHDSHGHHYSEEAERSLPLNRDVSADEIKQMFRHAGFAQISHYSYERKINHSGEMYNSTRFMFACTKNQEDVK